ncbi:MAG: DAK2 domain-containing protein, partial [Marinomonas sp.]
IIGPAPMMTALDMHGFSVSVMPATDAELNALTTPVPMPAWPTMQPISNPVVTAMPDGLAMPEMVASSDEAVQAMLLRVADVLIDAEAKLNALDAKSGDGDTGSTLAGAARTLQSRLDQLPLADTPQLLRALGNELGQTMGGSSGVILAIYFNAAGDACSNGVSIKDALGQGLARISEVGGAQVGDRTMIDALAPALKSLGGGLQAAALAAREGANSTADIHNAKAGRAAYVPSENLKDNNDPGAEAVALVFEGLAEL